MSQKAYLNILRVGVYFSFICVFFVFKNLLFPFITSKQIPFNMIVELLFIFWAAFIIKYPEYRPKKSWITFGLAGFMVAMLLSSIFGVDFNLSFWGDIERMLGFFHIAHFFLLYLIIITVFREWKDWKWLLIVSVAFSLGISFYGLKNIAYSTIGNTAYVSGYLIFNIYFAVLLFIKEEHKGLRWLYLIALPIQLLAFRRADTSGALVGLGFSVIVLFFLYGILHPNKKMKIATLTAAVLVSSFVVYNIVLDRDNYFTQNSAFVRRMVSGVNIHKDTFQTRLISWRAAIKDFKAHPILGTGHGNYALTFDKYFEPTFYDFTRKETYFDRAHNNVIDIATTTGIIGLVTYLSIFLATAYYLMRVYYEKKISVHEFVIISSLIVAYFVQNLAVFDSFVTYLSLMALLGYIYWLDKNHEYQTPVKDKPLNNPEIYAWAGVGLVTLVILYQFNYLPFKMLDLTIAGQKAWTTGDLAATTEAYKQALSYNTVLDRDSRNSYVRIIAANPGPLRQLPKDKAYEILDYAIDLAKKNVDYNPSDSMNQMMLAQVLNVAAMYHSDDPSKFAYYIDQSMAAIDKSIEASPGRIPIYFQKAQIYITKNEKDKALETLEYAYSLNENYYDSACHLGRTHLYYGDKDKGYDYIDKCIDLGGSELLSPASFVEQFIDYYKERGDWIKVAKLYTQDIALGKNNYETYVEQAKAWAKAGRPDLARGSADQALELNPDLTRYYDNFIAELEKMGEETGTSTE